MDSEPQGARSALLHAARAELDEHGRSAISLRAVARRAGVSHAAPQYHFGDRAGLLTAIATEGFVMLAAELRAAGGAPLAELGRVYIDFSARNPALFDLMFRPHDLHLADSELLAAQQDALAVLSSAVGGDPATAVPSATLMSWALAHGLAVLARDGALQTATGAEDSAEALSIARSLTDAFAATIGRASPGV